MLGRLRFVYGVATLFLMLTVATSAPRAEDYCSISAKCASILVDGRTGAVLAGHDPDKRVYPASLTKMMTLYLAFEALRDGRFRLTDTLPVSQRAAAQPPTRIGLLPGQRITMEDAIEAIAMKSANDIAVVVAEAVGGSQDGFVRRMNAKAQALGMRQTIFQNPSGLPDNRQLTTARDMALLARRILADFPNQRRYFGLPSAMIAGRAVKGHNRLLTRGECTGGKTGYIRESGFNLVAWKDRGDRFVIGAVFGGDSIRTRDRYMADLLRRGEKEAGVSVAGAGQEALRAAGLVAPLSAPSALSAPPAPRPRPDTHDLRQMIAGLETATQANLSLDESGICDPEEGEEGEAEEANAVQSQAPLTTPPASASSQAHIPSSSPRGHYLVPPPSPASTSPTAAAALASPARPAFSPTFEDSWSIQVGAYRDEVQARQAIARATQLLPVTLGATFPRTLMTPTTSGTLHRAQLMGLNEQNAKAACSVLAQEGLHCLAMPPGQSS